MGTKILVLLLVVTHTSYLPASHKDSCFCASSFTELLQIAALIEGIIPTLMLCAVRSIYSTGLIIWFLRIVRRLT